jgi:ATPase family associated with various cellular activities (AAA)
MEMRSSGAGRPATTADPWRRIEPAFGWSDLVLPDAQCESLRAIVSELLAQHGGNGGSSGRDSGPLVLFAGPVGTGKTMAARIVGSQLRMPILEVDTAALRARDRSGLEQLIGRLFATAEAEHAILFLEHADAILGERPLPSAHQGRPGALTAPYLFERAKRHKGPVIFASTLKGRIDPTYQKQFSSVVEFPFPDRASRERIWHQLLPSDGRLTQADVEELANSFQLPGAAIAGCCSAAIAAAAEQDVPVSLLHVAEAVQEEYRGRLASEGTRRAVRALVARAREPRVDSRESQVDSGAAGAVDGAGRNGAPPVLVPVADRAGPTRAASPRPHERVRRMPISGAGYALLSMGALVIAFAIGFAAARLGTGSKQPARPSRIAAGPVQVSLPAGWREVRAASPGLGLANEVTVSPRRDPRAHLTIGTLPPGDPALLPTSVLASLHPVPPAQITRLGSLSFYRYVTPAGGTGELVYATPTTGGTLVGVCTAPAGDARATTGCEQILGTVRLSSGSILGTAGGASYALALNAVIANLNAARSRIGPQLASAHTAALQATTASQLAAADASAALAVSKLNPGLANAVNTQLAAALRASAGAYGALAQAVRLHDPVGFAGARSGITSAQAAISSALSQLSALGYRVG